MNISTGEKLDVNLKGFIDLIEKDNTITEFKTSNQAMDQNSIDGHLQLTADSYAYEMLYRRPPSLLKLVDFVKAKRPKIITLQTEAKKLDYRREFMEYHQDYPRFRLVQRVYQFDIDFLWF